MLSYRWFFRDSSVGDVCEGRELEGVQRNTAKKQKKQNSAMTGGATLSTQSYH